MERGIITISENGTVTMPTAPVWMTMQEMADLFMVFYYDIRKAIRSIYKNHDTYLSSSIEDYETYTEQPFYQYIEKGGYPFITISVNPESKGSADYSAEAIEFLKNNLKSAALTYKDKPIFVFSHSPSKLTPWGAKWGYNTIHEVLKEYPQVIHFTGHTHYTIEDERSIC